MATTHPSRIFASGTASTLYVTIPAQIVTDSQFPFEADDDVVVTLDDDRLIVAPAEEDPG
jgi:hypothetical protein